MTFPDAFVHRLRTHKIFYWLPSVCRRSQSVLDLACCGNIWQLANPLTKVLPQTLCTRKLPHGFGAERPPKWESSRLIHWTPILTRTIHLIRQGRGHLRASQWRERKRRMSFTCLIISTMPVFTPAKNKKLEATCNRRNTKHQQSHSAIFVNPYWTQQTILRLYRKHGCDLATTALIHLATRQCVQSFTKLLEVAHHRAEDRYTWVTAGLFNTARRPVVPVYIRL